MSATNLAGRDDIEVLDPVLGELKQSAHTELRRSRYTLLKIFLNGKIKENFQEEYSEIVDQYFRISIQESETGHCVNSGAVLHRSRTVVVAKDPRIHIHQRMLFDESRKSFPTDNVAAKVRIFRFGRFHAQQKIPT